MPRKPPMTEHYRQILDLLTEHGPVSDPSGLAVPKLMEMTGHESTNALSKILRRMEAYGLVERQVKGTRTFAVGLPGTLNGAEPTEPAYEDTEPPADTAGLSDEDLERLAGVLLRTALRATRQADESPQLRRALQAAANDIRALEAQLSERTAELAAVKTELAEARESARIAEQNVQVLTAQLDKPKRGSNTIREMISGAEKEDLADLRRTMEQPPVRR